MSTILINELRPVGTAFFSDGESFLNELSDDVIADVNGGGTPGWIIATAAYSSWQCGAAITGAVGVIGTGIYTAFR